MGPDAQLVIDEAAKTTKSRKIAVSREQSLTLRLSVGPKSESGPLVEQVSYPQIGKRFIIIYSCFFRGGKVLNVTDPLY